MYEEVVRDFAHKILGSLPLDKGHVLAPANESLQPVVSRFLDPHGSRVEPLKGQSMVQEVAR